MFVKSKGYNCCSDSLISVHYMSPQNAMRLEMAFSLQDTISKLYREFFHFNMKVTFANIIDTYINLEKFESRMIDEKTSV